MRTFREFTFEAILAGVLPGKPLLSRSDDTMMDWRPRHEPFWNLDILAVRSVKLRVDTVRAIAVLTGIHSEKALVEYGRKSFFKKFNSELVDLAFLPPHSETDLRIIADVEYAGTHEGQPVFTITDDAHEKYSYGLSDPIPFLSVSVSLKGHPFTNAAPSWTSGPGDLTINIKEASKGFPPQPPTDHA